jgi:aladin
MSAQVLCEEQSALVVRGGGGGGDGSGGASKSFDFDAQSPIQLPEAGRALPPIAANHSENSSVAGAPDGESSSAAALPQRIWGWATALALGRALPPAPPTKGGTTAPVAWHCHQPR